MPKKEETQINTKYRVLKKTRGKKKREIRWDKERSKVGPRKWNKKGKQKIGTLDVPGEKIL